MASKMKKMVRQIQRGMRRRNPSTGRLVLGGMIGAFIGNRILDSTLGTVVGAVVGTALVGAGSRLLK